MNEETRAAFVAVHDHVDQTHRIQEAGRQHILNLITQNEDDIKALKRRIQTLSQTKIVQLMELTNARFELIIQQTHDIQRRLNLMQEDLDCPEQSTG